MLMNRGIEWRKITVHPPGADLPDFRLYSRNGKRLYGLLKNSVGKGTGFRGLQFRNCKNLTWGPIVMPMTFVRFCCAVALAAAVSIYAADKSKPAPPPGAADPYAEIQPAT